MQNQRNHTAGITLIEQLLVLSVIVVIALAGIRQYMTYRDQQNIAEIIADVQRIFSAMRDYFYIQDCDPKGNFQGKLSELDLASDLNLASLMQGRSPFFTAYHAKIETLPFTTQHRQPLYQFKVSATPSPEMLPEKGSYFFIKTNAYRIEKDKQTLQWKCLPTQQYQDKKSLWIMAEHLRQRKTNCAQ
ncbi:MAG: hypothetical protein A3F17_03365 [Gammaproteobacteria bacterium RIFCSPHIGHO2_12_FULL_41_15]|nr:MAG: hypothetical protein A3F17_03365 [Gammaproteobacteria bacterium RIFCSPHIGHO2_12_FULL_41_15]